MREIGKKYLEYNKIQEHSLLLAVFLFLISQIMLVYNIKYHNILTLASLVIFIAPIINSIYKADKKEKYKIITVISLTLLTFVPSASIIAYFVMPFSNNIVFLGASFFTIFILSLIIYLIVGAYIFRYIEMKLPDTEKNYRIAS